MSGAEPIQDALDAGAGRRARRPLRRRRDLRGRAAGARLRPGPGVERGQDRRVRFGRGDEPPGPGLHPLHGRGRRLRARAARPARTLHAGQRRRPHALRDRRPVPADDAVGHARRPHRDLRGARRPAGEGARRHLHARPTSTPRSSRARRRSVPLLLLGLDARPGDPRPARVVVRGDARSRCTAGSRARGATTTASISRSTARTARFGETSDAVAARGRHRVRPGGRHPGGRVRHGARPPTTSSCTTR